LAVSDDSEVESFGEEFGTPKMKSRGKSESSRNSFRPKHISGEKKRLINELEAGIESFSDIQTSNIFHSLSKYINN
jgi:hypothetical protein